MSPLFGVQFRTISMLHPIFTKPYSKQYHSPHQGRKYRIKYPIFKQVDFPYYQIDVRTPVLIILQKTRFSLFLFYQTSTVHPIMIKCALWANTAKSCNRYYPDRAMQISLLMICANFCSDLDLRRGYAAVTIFFLNMELLK